MTVIDVDKRHFKSYRVYILSIHIRYLKYGNMDVCVCARARACFIYIYIYIYIYIGATELLVIYN